jgi:hypothetical protein
MADVPSNNGLGPALLSISTSLSCVCASLSLPGNSAKLLSLPPPLQKNSRSSFPSLHRTNRNLIQTPLHSANSCSLQIFPQKTKQRSTFDNRRKEIGEELSSLPSVSFLPELGSLGKLYKVLVFSGTRFCYVFRFFSGFFL